MLTIKATFSSLCFFDFFAIPLPPFHVLIIYLFRYIVNIFIIYFEHFLVNLKEPLATQVTLMYNLLGKHIGHGFRFARSSMMTLKEPFSGPCVLILRN